MWFTESHTIRVINARGRLILRVHFSYILIEVKSKMRHYIRKIKKKMHIVVSIFDVLSMSKFTYNELIRWMDVLWYSNINCY